MTWELEAIAALFLTLSPVFGLLVLLFVAKALGFKWAAVSLVGMVGAHLAGGLLASSSVGIVAVAASLNMRGTWLFLVSFACVLILNVAASYKPTPLAWLAVLVCICGLLVWGWITARKTPPSSLDEVDGREKRRKLAQAQDERTKAAFEQAIGMDES